MMLCIVTLSACQLPTASEFLLTLRCVYYFPFHSIVYECTTKNASGVEFGLEYVLCYGSDDDALM